MLVNYEEHTRTLVISFDGEIDHHSCASMAVISDDAIKKYLPQKLIFDFRGVKFMDSAGIGMIIGRYKQLKARGISGYTKNVSPSVDKIFAMSGLYELFPLLD